MTFAFRAFLSLCLVVAWTVPASAQAPAAPAKQGVAEFVVAARSSAMLQLKAAEIAARSDARPEVKQFAQEMSGFRQAHLRSIEALATANKIALPADLTFEQKVLIENLAPLDFLALSRRYAELQVQALEQETQEYDQAAKRGGAAEGLIAEFLPQLRQQLDRAHGVAKAVGP
jgi:putative membrane protein